MSIVKIHFDVVNNNKHKDLGLEVWVDNHKFYDANPETGVTTVTLKIEENNSEHALDIILKNKSTEHTTVDSNGNILEDSILEISNFTVDDIDINQLFFEQSIYKHNLNNTAPEQQYKFYGTMGCNGTVKFKFETPFYLWMLENL